MINNRDYISTITATEKKKKIKILPIRDEENDNLESALKKKFKKERVKASSPRIGEKNNGLMDATIEDVVRLSHRSPTPSSELFHLDHSPPPSSTNPPTPSKSPSYSEQFDDDEAAKILVSMSGGEREKKGRKRKSPSLSPHRSSMSPFQAAMSSFPKVEPGNS